MALVSYESSGDEISDDESDASVPSKEKKNQNGVIAEPVIASSTGLDSDGGDKVEPEYKMRMPRSAKLPDLVPNLRASKTKSGRILLTIPSLDELDSSDDSAEESGKGNEFQRSKRVASNSAAQSKGGLLSLLPPTRALIVRDGDKPMIPHQLAVKRLSSVKPTSEPSLINKPTGTTIDEDNWEKDISNPDQENEDDDFPLDSGDGSLLPSGFFSFYQPTPEDAQAVIGARQAAASTVIQSMISTNLPKSPPSLQVEAVDGTTHSMSSTTNFTNSKVLPIRTPSLNPIEPSVLKDLEGSVPHSTEALAEDEDRCYWSDQTFVPGPERKRARLNLPGVRSAIPVDELLSSSNQPIREVSQDELTAGASIELVKSVTADESQYVSQRVHADDDPGKLAHRKHQITWLAYQAQESEMELQKRWAEARRNKASNRAKYGF